jgi:hypothetical protein
VYSFYISSNLSYVESPAVYVKGTAVQQIFNIYDAFVIEITVTTITHNNIKAKTPALKTISMVMK